ncbi:MAG: Uma2 family endonuclease [Microcystaceae cyanobacterium]
MINALDQTALITFSEFVDWYPLQSEYRYELHEGNIIQMPKPKGKHSQIAGFLMNELSFEIRKLGLPYFIPRECIVKSDERSGYETDVIVLDKVSLKSEPRWEKESTVTRGNSIKLIIEVVSSNWSDDYALKLDVYENLGIQEYWIVDYLGLGGRRFIGFPKQPTLTIYSLFDGQYQATQFRQGQLIQSPSLPSLVLTTQQAFQGQLE